IMNQKTKPIILIHGIWTTPHCWDLFRVYYEEQGYLVLTPAWPRIHGEAEDMRRDPSVLNGLGVTEIVDHYEKIIATLDTPPILIGHSFGGLVVQILLDRGLGAAGVAIDPANPKGVWPLSISVIKSIMPVLSNPFNYKRTIMPAFKQFCYAFANTMPENEARIIYDRYGIPGPGRPLFQAAFANLNPWSDIKVNYHNNNRAPLLLIGGSEDQICPAKFTKINYEKYSNSRAITEYQEFPHRSHLIIIEEGWQEVAEFALSWSQTKASTAAQ
ncbi:MAG: alpha/beta hydrolase, partial [Gammaproteobacteria bacterium]